ncbi:MAG: type IX secretion system membrane protein PorP/SprF, partial [Bacteroidota bacterium]
MKKALHILFLLGLLGAITAQDEAIFNHYVQSPIMLNPGAAGFADEYQLQVNARAAWSGFEESPKTFVARLIGPIGKSFGLGGAIFSESAAQQNRLKGQLDVAFRFGIGNEVRGETPFQMAFGFFTQFERVTVDNSILDNPLIQPGDEVLMNFINGENRFDAGIGVWGSYRKNTFGGLTLNNLVSN